MKLLNAYKLKYHFSVNFFSIFLLITFIPDILGINPNLVAYPFWALKALLAIWVITKYRRKIYHLKRTEQLFVFVALVYLINMFIDIFMQRYPVGIGSVRDLVGFGLSILIAFSFRFDSSFYSKKSFNIFVLTLAAGLCIAFFLAQESPPPLVNRYDANSTVNTINYGQMGCAMCLVAIFGFFDKGRQFGKFFFIIIFCVGALSIMKSGSRSPLVVLLVVGLFYALARLGFLKALIVCMFLIFSFWLSLDFLLELGDSFDSGLAERIISAIEKKETSGRDEIYANTLNIISKSPLFGDYYLVSSGIAKGYYPHNFFLEAFMTTGLVGGLPYLLMVFIAVYRSYVFLKENHESSWLILLFLQILVYGMFSSSLYSSQDFWALSLFVLSIPRKEEMGKEIRKKHLSK